MVPWGFTRYIEHVNPVSLNQSGAQMAVLVTLFGLISLIAGTMILQTNHGHPSSDATPETEPTEAASPSVENSSDQHNQRSMTLAKLSAHQQQSLDAIHARLRALLIERIGHIWSIENMPDITALYASDVPGGHEPFPYGLFRWRIEETDGEMKLFYDDCARIASGWGCAYEITATETRLTAEDID